MVKPQTRVRGFYGHLLSSREDGWWSLRSERLQVTILMSRNPIGPHTISQRRKDFMLSPTSIIFFRNSILI